MRVGYDVEMFVHNQGMLAAAADFIPGSKDEPHTTDSYNLHPDNIMVEFSCVGTVDTNEILASLTGGINFVKSMLPESAELMFSSSEEAASLLGHPSMEELGCQPDMVYGDERAIDTDILGTTRGAGFHIHFDTKLDNITAVRLCDMTVGLMSVALGEEQGERRKSYGCAGSHRPKPYGIEYRMLSGAFINVINTEPQQVAAVIELTAKILDNPNSYVDLMMLLEGLGTQVTDIINNEDQQAALEIYNNYIYPLALGDQHE